MFRAEHSDRQEDECDQAARCVCDGHGGHSTRPSARQDEDTGRGRGVGAETLRPVVGGPEAGPPAVRPLEKDVMPLQEGGASGSGGPPADVPVQGGEAVQGGDRGAVQVEPPGVEVGVVHQYTLMAKIFITDRMGSIPRLPHSLGDIGDRLTIITITVSQSLTGRMSFIKLYCLT